MRRKKRVDQYDAVLDKVMRRWTVTNKEHKELMKDDGAGYRGHYESAMMNWNFCLLRIADLHKALYAAKRKIKELA